MFSCDPLSVDGKRVGVASFCRLKGRIESVLRCHRHKFECRLALPFPPELAARPHLFRLCYRGPVEASRKSHPKPVSNGALLLEDRQL